MNSRRGILSSLCLCIALLSNLKAADETGRETAGSSTSGAISKASDPELQAIRERIAKQQEEINRMQEALKEQQALLERAVERLTAPASGSASPVIVAATPLNGGAKLTPTVNVAHPRIAAAGRWQNLQSSNPSPLSIGIGSTTFTPLGFVDFTWYGRSTNIGSGIGTNFGGIPFDNSAAEHLSETNFSTQNSRIGFRVDSNVLGAKVLGYFEADFLGNQPGNIFVTSNSDTFRMRNVFVDVQKGWLEILGGQDWSLFTPARKGLSPLPSDLFYTQNMDTNYQAGLIWSRQSQFRLIAHPTKDFAFGMSLENPQQYIGGSGGLSATAITLPSASNIAAAGSQFNNGNTNYSVPNLHPDIIFKGAYDGHVGKERTMHVEAGALIRSFKDSVAVGTPTIYQSHTAASISGEVNANLEVVKNFRIFANTFFGSGGGRYVFGLAPDVIIRADGSISPIHTYSTVDGFEANISKNTLIDAYYGGVYVSRNTALDTNGSTLIGYGAPTTSTSSGQGDNRTIQEFTFGLTQTFWKSANYGALSLINQYSYLTRDPWTVVPGTAKATHSNIYYIDLRYTLP